MKPVEISQQDWDNTPETVKALILQFKKELSEANKELSQLERVRYSGLYGLDS